MENKKSTKEKVISTPKQRFSLKKASAVPVESHSGKKVTSTSNTNNKPTVNFDGLFIEQVIQVKATPGEVWYALTDRDELENWWGDGVRLEGRKGGAFQERWEDDEGQRQFASGQVKVAQKEKQITFTWREQAWPEGAITECTFLIAPMKVGGKPGSKGLVMTEVQMKHTGWETLPQSKRDKILKDFKVGWNYHLKELKSYLDE